jgi:zinc transporter, ZIP family
MATAAIFGLLANSSLVVGVLLGLATKPPAAAAGGSHRLRRRGAGLGPDLRPWARPSSARPGLMPLPVSLSAPLSTCSLSPGWSAWPPAPQTHRPRPPGRGAGAAAKPETTEVAATTGLALLVGALIDGIPESAAIGLSLHAEGRSLGIVRAARGGVPGQCPREPGGAGRCGRRVAPAATSSASGPGVAVVCVLATIAGYRSWLTIRPSRKPVISAKDRFPVRRRRGCAGLRGRLPRGVAAAEAANPALRPRPSVTTMLVGLRLWLSPSDGGNRPLPEPVGQRPATKALHEVGALAQPPAGRGGLVTRLGAAGGLLQRPGSDRRRHRDQRQLTRSPLGCRPHLMAPIVANNGTGWWVALGLSQQQVEQHGAHDRGDHREQDHHQTARPTTQRADLHSSRSHGWLLRL